MSVRGSKIDTRISSVATFSPFDAPCDGGSMRPLPRSEAHLGLPTGES
jgi:hypothetical protein